MCHHVSADAGAVLHSHSRAAVMATLLTTGREFRISHIEMIKGIKKDSTGESQQLDTTLKLTSDVT